MPYKLPSLPYDYDALEPTIDAQTMEIHHSKHHATYVNNLNAALEGTEWMDRSLEDIFADLEIIPEDKRAAVRNNGGGTPTIRSSGRSCRRTVAESRAAPWPTRSRAPSVRAKR